LKARCFEKEVKEFAHSFTPDSLSSGIYVYVIKNKKDTISGKIVIIK